MELLRSISNPNPLRCNVQTYLPITQSDDPLVIEYDRRKISYGASQKRERYAKTLSHRSAAPRRPTGVLDPNRGTIRNAGAQVGRNRYVRIDDGTTASVPIKFKRTVLGRQARQYTITHAPNTAKRGKD